MFQRRLLSLEEEWKSILGEVKASFSSTCQYGKWYVVGRETNP